MESIFGMKIYENETSLHLITEKKLFSKVKFDLACIQVFKNGIIIKSSNEKFELGFDTITGVLYQEKKRLLMIYLPNEKKILFFSEMIELLTEIFNRLNDVYTKYLLDCLNKKPIEQLNIQFGRGLELDNGMLKQFLNEFLLKDVKKFDMTHYIYEMRGHHEGSKKRKMLLDSTKLRNIEVLEYIVREFTPAEIIKKKESLLDGIDVNALENLTWEAIQKGRIEFSDHVALECGMFTSFGKDQFSLLEVTDWYTTKKGKGNHYLNARNSAGKPKCISISHSKAKNLDVLEYIIREFTPAVKGTKAKTYNEITVEIKDNYHIRVDESAVMIGQGHDEIWLEFKELDGIATFDKKETLIIYTKNNEKYKLTRENTTNLLRNYDDLSDSWSEYILQKVTKDTTYAMKLRLGNKMILEKGIFKTLYSSMQLEDVRSVNYFKKYFNLRSATFCISSNEPMNQAIVKHIVYELAKGVLDYRHWDANVIKSDKMRQFESEHALAETYERFLAFSAILAITNDQSSRVFKMKKTARIAVANKLLFKHMWDISDKRTALQTLHFLSNASGHTPQVKEIYESYINGDAKLQTSKQLAAELMAVDSDEKLTKLADEIQRQINVERSMKCYYTAKGNLIQLGYTEAELSTIKSLAAWDYGRVGYIARNAVRLGYITEEEAWRYVEVAAKHASIRYRSWREYLGAYVLGRAVGYYNASGDIYPVLEYLLQDEDSPFQRLEFLQELPKDLFLVEMYADHYFPNFLVEKIKDLIANIANELENGKYSLEEIQEKFDIMTANINRLQKTFEENESEIEATACESICKTVDYLLKYFDLNLDVETALRKREW